MNSTGVEIGRQEVADPSSSSGKGDPDKIEVTVNLRESSIAQMFARNQLDLPQKTAADRFRGLCERAGLGRLKSQDLTRPKVDGGSSPDDIPGCRLDALRELGRLAGELGKVGYPVCFGVCGEGRSVRDVANAMIGRAANRRELDYYGKLLRDHLDLLCHYWGYKQRRH